MEKIFDLPAHPLFVHFPIVLIPLAAAAAIGLLLRPQLRERLGWWLVGSTLVGMIATILASKSGEPFEEALGPLGNLVDKHQELGEMTELMSIGFFLSALAMAIADRQARKRAPIEIGGVNASAAITVEQGQTMARAATALTVLCAVLGVLTTIWVIRTGHEGARITWSGLYPE